MVEQFQIILSQPPQQVFYPGSEVSGTLTVEVLRPRRFHDVTVSLIGEIQNSKDTNEYFNAKDILWNREQARGGKFPSGRHNFRF